MQIARVNAQGICWCDFSILSTGDEFKAEFLRALSGEPSAFGSHITIHGRPARPDRLSWPRWNAIRQLVFERDDWTCTYCGASQNLECDHVTPVALGGSDKIDNLATACRTCNRSKGAKPLAEWRQ